MSMPSRSLRRAALGTLLPGFVGSQEPPAWVARHLADGLAGVCLYGENVTDADSVPRLTGALREADPELVVAVDEEGGDVTRLFFDVGSPFPGNALLGRVDDLAWTRDVAARVGQAVLASGCTLVLGPVADVNADPDNPVIGVRSVGADAGLVARHTSAWVTGLQSTGAAACAKHFPGHGDTATDSHVGLPVLPLTREQLAARDLVPFEAAVRAGTRSVMTSHILLPQIDPGRVATVSPVVLGELLRRDLGFDGVVVTDALDMAGASRGIGIPEAAVRALVAGCDLLCLGTGTTGGQVEEIVAAIGAAVGQGHLDAARVHEAAERSASLRAAPPTSASRRAGLDPDDLRRCVTGFAVGERARGWLDRHAGRSQTVVLLDGDVNIAAGQVPWGLEAALADERAASRSGQPEVAVVREPDVRPGREEAVVAVGKDLHRQPGAAARLASLRDAGADVLAVDLGWPDERAGLVDLATFGGSRLVGAALLAVLRGEVASP